MPQTPIYTVVKVVIPQALHEAIAQRANQQGRSIPTQIVEELARFNAWEQGTIIYPAIYTEEEAL